MTSKMSSQLQQAAAQLRDAGNHELATTLEEAATALLDQQASLHRIQRLPAADWATASAQIMQAAASAARAGYQKEVSPIVQAIDLAKVYVRRLEARVDELEDVLRSIGSASDPAGKTPARTLAFVRSLADHTLANRWQYGDPKQPPVED